jgi:hypothetical protein
LLDCIRAILRRAEKGVPPRHTRHVTNSQHQLADALADEFFGVEKEDEIPDRPPPSHITASPTPADNKTTLTSHAPGTPSSGTTARKIMMSTMYEMRLISEHVNPKYLASDDFWAEGCSKGAFEKALEMYAAVEREKSLLTSSVRGLLGVKQIEDALNHDDYPTLVGQLHVNLKYNQTIQALLRDIIKLSKNVEAVKILKFQAGKDKLQSLMHLPRSSRVHLFNKNDVHSGWGLKVLDAIIEPADNVNNEPPVDDDILDVEKEICESTADAARWSITCLEEEIPDAHVEASQAIEMPIHNSGPMESGQTAAMFREANLGKKGCDVLR